MSLAARVIAVNGIDVTVDTQALNIRDIDEAQRTSAAQMAFWASVWGSAEGEREAADAHYREWRAKATERVLSADHKAAEWKVKAAIESHPDFVKLKTALSKAIDNSLTAKGMYESWAKRANLAQSLGAAEREVLRKTGEGTTRVSDSAPSEGSPKERHDIGKRDRLKAALKKKSERATEDG